MKNTILRMFAFLTVFLLMAMGVSAMTPVVVYGKAVFDGKVYSNTEVKIIDGNDFWMAYTTGDGTFTFDASNFKRSDGSFLRAGDIVTLGICPTDGCKKTITLSANPLKVDFGVNTENCPIIVCPTCLPQVTCNDPEECEGSGVTIWELLAGLFLLAGGTAGGYFVKRKEALSKGVGIKIYTKNDGTEGVYHKHPGIIGYHSPYTVHQDKLERHPKGELAPKYEKNTECDWVYIGN